MEVLEVFTFTVAVILLILPIIDWTAAYILYKAYKRSNSTNIAMKERGKMAGALAIASTLNASLAFVRLSELHPDPIIPIVILSTSLILGSVPNIYWLFLYLTNRLRK